MLQRKLSIKMEDRVVVVNRGREQLIGNAKGNTQQLDQRSEPEWDTLLLPDIQPYGRGVETR